MSAQIGILLPYRMDEGLVEFASGNLNINAELTFLGAQDGKSDDQLRELGKGIAPNSYAENLEDGSTVFITRETVVEGMKQQTGNLLEQGCDAVMVCCSLPWPELDGLANVLTPCAVLESCAVSIAPESGIACAPFAPLKASASPKTTRICSASSGLSFRSLLANCRDRMASDLVSSLRPSRIMAAKRSWTDFGYSQIEADRRCT
jgi:hypothetical protein